MWIVVQVSQRQLSKPREMSIGKHGAAQHAGRPIGRGGGGGSQSDKGKKDPPLDVASLLLTINQKLDSHLPLRATVNGVELVVQVMSEKIR